MSVNIRRVSMSGCPSFVCLCISSSGIHIVRCHALRRSVLFLGEEPPAGPQPDPEPSTHQVARLAQEVVSGIEVVTPTPLPKWHRLGTRATPAFTPVCIRQMALPALTSPTPLSVKNRSGPDASEGYSQ